MVGPALSFASLIFILEYRNPVTGQIETYILAGGKSSRFGSDKALAPIDGKPLLMHQIRAVAPVAASLTVIADKNDKYHNLGIRTIADSTPGLGPMGGLKTALEDQKQNNWILLVACDAYGLRTEWLETLIAKAIFGAKIVCFKGERYEPFPALYHPSIYEIVMEQLRAGQRSMQGLTDTVMKRGLDAPEDFHTLRNINTPQDLPK